MFFRKGIAFFLLSLFFLPILPISAIQANTSALRGLIITDEGLHTAALDLGSFKNSTGMSTFTTTAQEIAKSYQGRDLAEKIRNFIIYAYRSWNIKWVILAGDVEKVPTRLVYNPDIYTEPEDYDHRFTATDYYYAGLEGDWDADGDNNFGENRTMCANGVDETDFTPEVYVGRLPASSSTELQIIVDKIKGYRTSEKLRRTLFIGGNSPAHYEGQEYCALVYNVSGMLEISQPKVMLTTSSRNLTYYSAKQYFNDGFGAVVSISHGDISTLASEDSQGNFLKIFDERAARDATNAPNYSFWFIVACESGRFDASDKDCLAEHIILSKNGGCIGVIAHSRISWGRWLPKEHYTSGGGAFELNWRFWQKIFKEHIAGSGEALYKAKADYVSIYGKMMQQEDQRRDILGMNLLGDPSIDLVMYIIIIELASPSASMLCSCVALSVLTLLLKIGKKRGFHSSSISSWLAHSSNSLRKRRMNAR